MELVKYSHHCEAILQNPPLPEKILQKQQPVKLEYANFTSILLQKNKTTFIE